MSYLGLKVLFNSLTATPTKVKPLSYYVKKDKEEAERKRQTEQKLREEKEKAKRKEYEKLMKPERERIKSQFLYDVEHLTQVSRALTDETTLCMTDAKFTSRGLEIKCYVSYDNEDGEIFTIRAKIREDNTLENISKNKESKIREVEFEYLGKIFTLDDKEINKLCNRKDYTELSNYYLNLTREKEKQIYSQI